MQAFEIWWGVEDRDLDSDEESALPYSWDRLLSSLLLLELTQAACVPAAAAGS
jgi:hypothetical protein